MQIGEELQQNTFTPLKMLLISSCEFESQSSVLSFQPEGLSIVFLVGQV